MLEAAAQKQFVRGPHAVRHEEDAISLGGNAVNDGIDSLHVHRFDKADHGGSWVGIICGGKVFERMDSAAPAVCGGQPIVPEGARAHSAAIK